VKFDFLDTCNDPTCKIARSESRKQHLLDNLRTLLVTQPSSNLIISFNSHLPISGGNQKHNASSRCPNLPLARQASCVIRHILAAETADSYDDERRPRSV
jgi:hypothetical protein